MKYLLLCFLLSGVVFAQLLDNPELRTQILLYSGATNETWFLDARDRENVKIIGWDRGVVGKKPPTDMTQLPSREQASQWKKDHPEKDEKRKYDLDTLSTNLFSGSVQERLDKMANWIITHGNE